MMTLDEMYEACKCALCAVRRERAAIEAEILEVERLQKELDQIEAILVGLETGK